jgi:hypothetical protein
VSDGLSACLEGYRNSGQLDSSGEFTLSKDHAQRKLRQFTLPEPRLYVLNLVASAVCGGASYLDFRTDADELWLKTDGRLEDARELEHLESLAFSSQTSSALKELAIALNGILPLKPKLVTLEVQDQNRRFQLDWDGQQFVYQELEGDGSERFLKLHVQEKLGARVARKFAAKVGGGMLPDSEEDAIFRYCNRCPVRIEFNGSPVNRPVILGHARHITFSHSGFPPGHILARLSTPLAAPLGVSGVLALGGRLAPWVTLVFQGVNFRLPEDAFPLVGLRGIVYCDRLRKDLSQVQLVQDEAFRDLIGDINRLGKTI